MKVNSIIGVIGPKGSGKTHYICELARSLPRVAFFDTVHEPAYISAADQFVIANPNELASAIMPDTFKVCYRTLHLESGFDHFIRLCYLKGNLTAVIDEADLICSPQYISETFRTIISVGRHRELSILYITRRFSNVNRLLTSQESKFVFFRTSEPLDVAAIADRCGNSVASQVQDLPRIFPEDAESNVSEFLEWGG
jgi:hypothetical protein